MHTRNLRACGAINIIAYRKNNNNNTTLSSVQIFENHLNKTLQFPPYRVVQAKQIIYPIK